jgi:hypothetical protein
MSGTLCVNGCIVDSAPGNFSKTVPILKNFNKVFFAEDWKKEVLMLDGTNHLA